MLEKEGGFLDEGAQPCGPNDSIHSVGNIAKLPEEHSYVHRHSSARTHTL